MLISAHYDGTHIPEALRMLKPGGLILRLDIASDWDGGELNQVIVPDQERVNVERRRDQPEARANHGAPPPARASAAGRQPYLPPTPRHDMGGLPHLG